MTGKVENEKKNGVLIRTFPTQSFIDFLTGRLDTWLDLLDEAKKFEVPEFKDEHIDLVIKRISETKNELEKIKVKEVI